MSGRSGRLLRALGKALALALLALLLVPAGLVALFRHVNPPTSAFMIEARVDALSDPDPRPFKLQQQWRDLRQISPQAAIAVVASEDQQFPYHSGFDLQQIQKARQEAARGGRARGASTLTQQTAKNLFLWGGHSYVRKGFEAYLTVLLEWLWPKQRILEVYLNLAQFGRGIYGVQAAARLYFHKDAAQLSESEAALLAAVLPNPLRLRADRPSRYVLGRRASIQLQMRALGGPRYLQGILPERLRDTSS